MPTAESVLPGHPDKACDQIADAILDAHLKLDAQAHTAIEVLATNDRIVIAGELQTTSQVDHEAITRNTLTLIGYTPENGLDPRSIPIYDLTTAQSPEISRAVTRQDGTIGAGDQGVIHGYATDATPLLIHPAAYYAHQLTDAIRTAQESNALAGTGPDGKVQITTTPTGQIDTVIASIQHIDPATYEADLAALKTIINTVCPQARRTLINPSGSFTKGGPAADTGLTGRKIIIDTCAVETPHGGGAFSGKDPTKVDRSAAYAARHAAVNIVQAGLAHECHVTLAYAIGQTEPVEIMARVDAQAKTTSEQATKLLQEAFDFTPTGIINRLKLRTPIYARTATGAHYTDQQLPWNKADVAEHLREEAKTL